MAGPNINDVASGTPQQFFDAELPAYSFAQLLAVLSGTVAVVNGSLNVTFSTPQTLNAGTALYFAAWPGAPFYLAANVVASTTGTLTVAYSGVAGAATTATYVAALAGTVSVTNQSTAITFSTAQTLPAGTQLQFSSQPGVFYTLSGALAGATAGTLTQVFIGTTAAGLTTIPVAALSGTVAVTNASAAVTFSSVQTLPALSALMFASQPGVIYTLAAALAGATAGTLTTPYTGTTAGATTTVAGTNDFMPSRDSVSDNVSGVCRGLLCTSTGVAVLDLYGVAGPFSGLQNVPVPMTVGQQLQLAFTKLHHTSTGAFVALY